MLPEVLRSQHPAARSDAGSEENAPSMSPVDLVPRTVVVEDEKGVAAVSWTGLEPSPVVRPSALEVEGDDVAPFGWTGDTSVGVATELLHGAIVDTATSGRPGQCQSRAPARGQQPGPRLRVSVVSSAQPPFNPVAFN